MSYISLVACYQVCCGVGTSVLFIHVEPIILIHFLKVLLSTRLLDDTFNAAPLKIHICNMYGPKEYHHHLDFYLEYLSIDSAKEW